MGIPGGPILGVGRTIIADVDLKAGDVVYLNASGHAVRGQEVVNKYGMTEGNQQVLLAALRELIESVTEGRSDLVRFEVTMPESNDPDRKRYLLVVEIDQRKEG